MKVLRAGGFTLIELMIVVAILSIVAVLAVVSYGSYIRRSSRSEVIAMLGEIRIKEEAYLAENSRYISTTTNETTYEPGTTPFQLRNWSGYNAKWDYLGVKPPRTQLYCGYTAQGDDGLTNTPGSVGQGFLGTGTLTTPWFYARGCCDYDSRNSLTCYNIVYNSTMIQGL